MKTLRASLHSSYLLLTAALAFTPAAAHAISLSALLGGQTITADDKLFSGWTQIDLVTVNGGFADPTKFDVTPLVDDPLNPGVNFTSPIDGIGTPFGHTGPSSVIFTFSFNVQTTGGQPIIKDNSLRITDWTFDSGPNAFIQITETVLNAAGGTIGDKQVVARPGETPPDLGNPNHFDTLNFAPVSFLHIVKRIEIQGPGTNDGARLEMFEQRFSQLPEPASVLMAACSTLACIRWRRRPAATLKYCTARTTARTCLDP